MLDPTLSPVAKRLCLPRRPAGLRIARALMAGILLAGMMGCLGPTIPVDPGTDDPAQPAEAGWVRLERARTTASWTGELLETWTWDDQGRLIESLTHVPCYCVSGHRARHLWIAWDDREVVITVDYDDDGSIDQRHRHTTDDQGRIVRLEQTFNETEQRATTFDWDDEGRLVRTIDDNGDVEEATLRADGQATAVAHNGEVLVRRTYDEKGRLLTHDNGDVYTFDYDDHDNVIAHTYARPGNFAHTTHHRYDEAHRLLGSDAFEDTLRDEPISGVSYTYDEAGRPLSFSVSDTLNDISTTTTNVFDDEGRLVERKWSDADGGARTRFDYELTEDGDLAVVARIDGDEVVTRTVYRQLQGARDWPNLPSLWPSLPLPTGEPLPPLAELVLQD